MAVVQSRQSIVTGVTGATNLAYSSSPTAGNTLVISATKWTNDSAAFTTPTATSHTFTSISSQQAAGGDNRVQSWYELNNVGGATTVSLDVSGAASADITFVIGELSGVANIDGAAVAATGTSTTPSSGAKTPSAYTSQLWGVVSHIGNDRTITQDGAWTLLHENEGGTSNMPLSVIYRTLASGSDDASWTFSGSVAWMAHVFAFTPASGTNATATVASATGSAHNPSSSVQPRGATQAAVTATAHDATATKGVAPIAAVASATGSAHDATATRTAEPIATVAAATGSAHNATTMVAPTATVASATATAPDADVAEDTDPPAVASHATTVGTSASGTAANLPAGIAAGDFLWAFGSLDTAGGSISFTTPTGWTSIASSVQSTAIRMQTWARIATGDANDAFSITCAQDFVLHIVRVTGHSATSVFDGTHDTVGATGSAGSTAPDSAAASGLTSGGYLILSQAAIEMTATTDVISAGPSGYTVTCDDPSVGAGSTTGAMLGVAYKQITAATGDDPGAWTLNASRVWRANTYWIRGAAAANETDAPATEATGTGSAHSATTAVAPAGGNASGTGTATNPSATVATPTTVASGTGSAHSATTATAPSPAGATATGAASTATSSVAPSSAVGTATGSAHDATALTGTLAVGVEATATGSSHNPAATVAPPTTVGGATGAAHDATVNTSSGGETDATATVAAATGSAHNPSVSVGPQAGVASHINTAFATGTAHDATTTGPSASATATVAEATVTAHDPVPDVAPPATVPSSTATSHNPTVTGTTTSAVAAALANAHNAVVLTSFGEFLLRATATRKKVSLSETETRRQGVHPRWARRFSTPTAPTILKIDGSYIEVQMPSRAQLAEATEIYLGGHEYEIDGTIASALTAAGFGAYLTQVG